MLVAIAGACGYACLMCPPKNLFENRYKLSFYPDNHVGKSYSDADI